MAFYFKVGGNQAVPQNSGKVIVAARTEVRSGGVGGWEAGRHSEVFEEERAGAQGARGKPRQDSLR